MSGVMWRFVLGAALATVVRAQEADPAGEWQVVDPAGRGGTRSVTRTAEGGLELLLRWPGTHEEVTLRGRAAGGGLELRGEAGGRGFIEALRGDASDLRPVRVRLRGSPLAPAEPEGGERLEVDLSVDGRPAGREVWSRAGRPGLRLLALTPGEWFDPKRAGPLRVEFLVRGAPQSLRFRILLPAGQDRRAAFYAARVPRGAEGLEVRTWTVGPQTIGSGTTEYDGRDGSAARRLLLGGRYRLRVESLEHPELTDELELQVATPHAEFVAPRWMQTTFVALDGTTQPDLGMDQRAASLDVADRLRALGFRPHARVTTVDAAAVAEALAGSAQVTISTHGTTRGVHFYRAREDELTARPIPAQDPTRIFHVAATQLQAALRGRLEERPLKDLHTVFVWACLTGTNGAAAGSSQPVDAGTGLPSWLVQAGADVVVAFDLKVLRVQGQSWLPRLLADLAGASDGATPPRGGVRSLMWAVKEAAQYSDRYWGNFGPEQRATLRERDVGPLSDCVRLFCGAGIDPDQETLDPPRYGDSSN